MLARTKEQSRVVGGALQKVQYILSIAAAISFFAGYTIALVAGIWWPENGALITLLVVMGLLVGLFNVTAKEIVPYLVAAIALVLVGTSNVFEPLNNVRAGLGNDIDNVVRLMAVFTAPAAAVQAIRAGMALARPG